MQYWPIVKFFSPLEACGKPLRMKTQADYLCRIRQESKHLQNVFWAYKAFYLEANC